MSGGGIGIVLLESDQAKIIVSKRLLIRIVEQRPKVVRCGVQVTHPEMGDTKIVEKSDRILACCPGLFQITNSLLEVTTLEGFHAFVEESIRLVFCCLDVVSAKREKRGRTDEQKGGEQPPSV